MMPHVMYLLALPVLLFPAVARAELLYEDAAPPNAEEEDGTGFSPELTFESDVDPQDENNLVGRVDMFGRAAFSDIHSGIIAIAPENAGKEFSWTVDWLIPADSALEAMDNIFVQLDIIGQTTFSTGFATGATVARDTWSSYTVTGTIPNGTTGVRGFFSISDNGFEAGAPDTVGNAIAYLDNLRFETIEGTPGDFNGDGSVNGFDFVQEWQRNLGDAASFADWEGNYGAVPVAAAAAVAGVPEPGSILLLAMGSLGLWVRRR
ncbi:PEP-CTERM sorting domain-containing protein [Pirellulales bacterium]|nr:PEP-CTERM sorting domain-containing protein [Pirellulales bacterium]